MEQDRKSRDKSMHLKTAYPKGHKNIQWRKTVPSTSYAEKTGQLQVKQQKQNTS